MADKNRNGIPDDEENLRGGRSRSGTFSPSSKLKPGVSPAGYAASDKSSAYQPSTRYGGVGGEIANFSNDVTRNLGNFLSTLGGVSTQGGGFGDSLVGSHPMSPENRPKRNAIKDRKIQKGYQGGLQPEDSQKTLADYLAMAAELIGGGGGVNYDPQRNAARSQAAEGDARLEAMYRQLRGSIDADAPVLNQAYEGAIDSSAQTSQNAQAQAQAATDSANARNNEVLANLGIEQAAGNIVQNGTDLNTQTAQNIGDMAARGQAVGDRLASNQSTAIQHNTNIGNAAGLEGNLQRAANQSSLQSLLAEIDMQEQQENAAYGQNQFSQQLGMAQELLGFDRYNQEREDNLQMSAAEMMAEQQQQTALPNFDQLMQALAARGLKLPEDDPSQLMKMLDQARKFSY